MRRDWNRRRDWMRRGRRWRESGRRRKSIISLVEEVAQQRSF